MILHSVFGEGNPISSELQHSHLAAGWVLAAVTVCPKMILSFVVYNEIMLDMSCVQSFPAYLNYDRASNWDSKEEKHFRCWQLSVVLLCCRELELLYGASTVGHKKGVANTCHAHKRVSCNEAMKIVTLQDTLSGKDEIR